MPQVTLDTVTLAKSPNFNADGKWCEACRISAPLYEIGYPDAAGVDGVARKRFGFRARPIMVEALYVGASEAAVISAIDTDLKGLANHSFSVNIGGVTFPSCELEPTSYFSEPRGAGGKFFSKAVFYVTQRALQ